MSADTDMARAAAVVARILRSPPSADPDVTARHIVTALRGHGWRPTAALPLPPWEAKPGPPLPVDRVHAHASTARQGISRKDPP